MLLKRECEISLESENEKNMKNANDTNSFHSRLHSLHSLCYKLTQTNLSISEQLFKHEVSNATSKTSM